MRPRLLICLAALIALASPGRASGQSQPDPADAAKQEARKLFEQAEGSRRTGDALRAQGDARGARRAYARAGADYYSAFTHYRHSAFIFNWAQMLRLSGDARAIEAYAGYLALEPNGSHAKQARDAIAELQATSSAGRVQPPVANANQGDAPAERSGGAPHALRQGSAQAATPPAGASAGIKQAPFAGEPTRNPVTGTSDEEREAVEHGKGRTSRRRSSEVATVSAREDTGSDASRKVKHYGWQIFLVDAASMAAVVSGVGFDNWKLTAWGALGYGFGGPLVHCMRGKFSRGLGSYGLRVLLPGAGAGVGALVGYSLLDSGTGGTSGALIGLVAGFGTALILDWRVLPRDHSRIPPGPKTHLAPSLTRDKGTTLLGLSGRF